MAKGLFIGPCGSSGSVHRSVQKLTAKRGMGAKSGHLRRMAALAQAYAGGSRGAEAVGRPPWPVPSRSPGPRDGGLARARLSSPATMAARPRRPGQERLTGPSTRTAWPVADSSRGPRGSLSARAAALARASAP